MILFKNLRFTAVSVTADTDFIMEKHRYFFVLQGNVPYPSFLVVKVIPGKNYDVLVLADADIKIVIENITVMRNLECPKFSGKSLLTQGIKKLIIKSSSSLARLILLIGDFLLCKH